MTLTDMSTFMGHDGRIRILVILAVEHDIAHPTEGRHIIAGHADNGAIGLWVLFALADEAYYLKD